MKSSQCVVTALCFASLIGVVGCQSVRSETTPDGRVRTAQPIKPEDNPLVQIDFRWRYDWTAAKRLLDEKNYREAEAAFQKLAATAPSAEDKAKCLSLAAMAMGHQEDRYEAAMEIAEAIASNARRVYTEMVILSTYEKFQDLIDRFKDEEIAAWPEDISYEGFYLRGRAHYALEDIPATIADYEACSSRVNPRERLWPNIVNSIASLYGQLDKDAEALETYEKAFAVYDQGNRWKGGSYHGRSVLGAAAILADQEEYEKALNVLNRYEIASSSMGYRVVEAAGDMLAKLGRTDEAIARYREAIAANTRFERNNAGIQAKIDALKEEQK